MNRTQKLSGWFKRCQARQTTQLMLSIDCKLYVFCFVVAMGGCRKLRALWACALVVFAATCTAQSLTKSVYKAPSGESVQFLGDSASLKYFPAASANCSQCYLAFKLGALSELDAVSLRLATSKAAGHATSVPAICSRPITHSTT